MADHKLAIEKEEKLIRKLDKKLGINRKKRKEKRSFELLGLGDIFNIIDSTESYFDQSLNNQAKKQKTRSKSLNQNKFKEDIYGRLIDKNGNVLAFSKCEKEFKPKSENESDLQLLKKIRGLLNRLTLSNLAVVSNQIEDFLKEFSLNQLCFCVSKCIQDLIVCDSFLSSQKLISELTMLMTVLYCNTSEEVGGHFIHYFITQFDLLFNQIKESNNYQSKKIDNILILISYLYSWNLIESNLIFEILNKLVNDFSNKCIELIHLMLQLIGFRLRKDDPVGLKKLFIHINCAAVNHDYKDSRIRFMLETLKAIKNNNIYKLANFNPDFPISCIDVQVLRNNLQNCIKIKSKANSIPGRYNDILKSNHWYIKFETLIENKSNDNFNLESKEETLQTNRKNDEIDTLCDKLRLVTPLRRSLFRALINGYNFIDCCDKLLEIGKKQFDEINNVCLLVALKEKTFNQFYVYLFKRFSQIDRKLKLSLNFVIRDKITNLEFLKLKERLNLSILISHLVKLDVIPITVLKVIEFSDLNEIYVEFLKQIIESILSEDENVITKILSKIKNKDSFATAFRLFISCFLDASYKRFFQK